MYNTYGDVFYRLVRNDLSWFHFWIDNYVKEPKGLRVIRTVRRGGHRHHYWHMMCEPQYVGTKISKNRIFVLRFESILKRCHEAKAKSPSKTILHTKNVV